MWLHCHTISGITSLMEQVFTIIDTETTKKNALVFDAAWRSVTRKGNLLGTGSYLIKDALSFDNLWFTEKMAQYYLQCAKGFVRPVTFRLFKRLFIQHISWLKSMGYEVVICAYNAKFDHSALDNTAKRFMKGESFWDDNLDVSLMDLWHAWVKDCPDHYGEVCEWTGWINQKGFLKKYTSPKSSAQAVYRYISGKMAFEEKHLAISDTLIEQEILMDILSRDQELPIVKSADEIFSNPSTLLRQRFAHLAPPKPENWQELQPSEDEFFLAWQEGYGTEQVP